MGEIAYGDNLIDPTSTTGFINYNYISAMLSSNDIEYKLKQVKPVLEKRFNVSHIGYFGSYATGLANAKSDLDLLVEFSSPIGWNFFTLESFLENTIGVKIDIVTKNALKEIIKERILKEVKYI